MSWILNFTPQLLVLALLDIGLWWSNSSLEVFYSFLLDTNIYHVTLYVLITFNDLNFFIGTTEKTYL